MATTGTLVEWLASGVITVAGTPLASGKVFFYQPGTLTPVSVFSDSACTVAISQPVNLSAGGSALVYANTSVRMIVKDASAVSILFDVVENVQRDDNTFVTSPSFNGGTETTLATIMDAWATTGGGGSTVNWGYKQSGTATERALKSWMAEVHVSVKDFGALGDGSNNDTTAIQNAISAVGTAGGGVVLFPPGTYNINSALSISNNGIFLRGAGFGATTIKQTAGAANGVTVTSANSIIISDMTITATSSTGTAISLTTCSDVIIENVASTLFGKTILMASCLRIAILNCNLYATNGGSGATIQTTGTTSVTTILGGQIAPAVTNGKCVDFGGSGTGAVIGTNFLFNANSTAIVFTAGTGYRVIGCFGLNLLTTPFTAASDPFLYQYGNGFDGYTVNVATGGNVTPDLMRGPVIRLVANSGGAGTVTVNNPTPTPANTQRGFRITIKYVNAAGGAVTWAFGTQFVHVAGSGVPASTDLHTISVDYLWDPDATKWREVTRGDTLT